MTITGSWRGTDGSAAHTPVIVLIHGLGASHRVFDLAAPQLMHSYRLLLVDITGRGRITAQAIQLARLLHTYGITEAVVVGHSRGGLVATALAETAPDLVGQLVLVNTPPTVDSRIAAGSVTETALRLPGLGPLLWRVGASPQRLRRGLATAVAPGRPVPEILVEDLRATRQPDFVAATTGIDDYVRAATLPDRLRLLPQSVNVHVVFGVLDQRVDPAVSIGLYRGVFGATVTELAASGHTPPLEVPAAFAEAVLAVAPDTRASDP